jgi:hypothetical protein
MKASTFQLLVRLRDKYGPGLFGKIAQKLLAVAFYEASFSHVVERGVQGVDLDAANGDGQKYTLEVKTTDGQTVSLSKENLDALRVRAVDGYVPVIAALRLHMFEDWLFAGIPLSELQPGLIPFSRLRAYRLRQLEQRVCPVFEAVVEQHFTAVLAHGERYLIDLLEQRPSKQS